MTRDELLDAIATNARILGKLSLAYDYVQRKHYYSENEEFQAQRYMVVRRNQIELLKKLIKMG